MTACAVLAESRPPHSFLGGLRDARLPGAPGPVEPVTAADLANLPLIVQRYLGFMGVVGRRPTWSFAAHLTGRFRRSEHEAWMPAEAWQYNSSLEVARLFQMKLKFAGRLPMTGWDTYRLGRGRMLGKLLGVVTVADGSGAAFDIGELTTYLNDVVLLAPGMLLRLPTTWAELGAHAFRVSLTDEGRTVSADVTVNADGQPTEFTTMDRFMDQPGGPVRMRWSTPVEDWQFVDGRAVFTLGRRRVACAGRPTALRGAEPAFDPVRRSARCAVAGRASRRSVSVRGVLGGRGSLLCVVRCYLA